MLIKGGVGVIATDTLYGLVACAQNPNAVKRVYLLKGRTPNKACLILISSVDDLGKFGVTPSVKTKGYLNEHWPGPISIIMDCPGEELSYLHRGTNSLGFRLPAKRSLRQLLALTGPLIAPSANPEGQPPAKNITQAKDYFGSKVNFYVAGKTISKASKIVRISSDDVEVLRH